MSSGVDAAPARQAADVPQFTDASSGATARRDEVLTRREAETLCAVGLSIVAAGESGYPRSAAYFTRNRGRGDGRDEYAMAATTIGQPAGTTIYFAVDYDATQADTLRAGLARFAWLAQSIGWAGQGTCAASTCSAWSPRRSRTTSRGSGRAGHTKFGSDRMLAAYDPTFVFSCYQIHKASEPPALPCAASWLARGFEPVTMHIPGMRERGEYYTFLAKTSRSFQCPGRVY